MPPKSARKGSGGSAGPRRTGSRAAKAKALREAEAAEEPPKFEEVAAPVIEAKEEEIKAEEVVQDDKPSVTDSAVNGSVDVECMDSCPLDRAFFIILEVYWIFCNWTFHWLIIMLKIHLLRHILHFLATFGLFLCCISI